MLLFAILLVAADPAYMRGLILIGLAQSLCS
jgi:ACR3 family arsenite efflux pump ArsB